MHFHHAYIDNTYNCNVDKYPAVHPLNIFFWVEFHHFEKRLTPDDSGNLTVMPCSSIGGPVPILEWQAKNCIIHNSIAHHLTAQFTYFTVIVRASPHSCRRKCGFHQLVVWRHLELAQLSGRVRLNSPSDRTFC